MRKINDLIRNEKGESIAETLIATLIASFALILLAGMMTASVRVVTESKQTMSKYYDSVNKMAKKTEPVSMKITIQDEKGSSSVFDVNGYMSSDDTDKAVIIYEKEMP